MPWHYALCKRFHIPIDLCDSIFIGGGGNAGASAGVVAMGATVGLAAAAAFTWSANRPEASVRALGRIEVGQVVASAVAMVGFAVGGKTFWVYASALGLLLAAAARAYIPRARGPGGLA
ncbi:MAG TPA: hypothetical protein VI997_08895, partial [Candidatus Thermoplasmatota archaeon]|nr:hypothetical protein [Candidatus Thermoplasmatota archaeon]